MECIRKYFSLKEYLIYERPMWKVSHKIVSKDLIYWHTVLGKYAYIKVTKRERGIERRTVVFPGWSTRSTEKDEVKHQTLLKSI